MSSAYVKLLIYKTMCSSRMGVQQVYKKELFFLYYVPLGRLLSYQCVYSKGNTL